MPHIEAPLKSMKFYIISLLHRDMFPNCCRLCLRCLLLFFLFYIPVNGSIFSFKNSMIFIFKIKLLLNSWTFSQMPNVVALVHRNFIYTQKPEHCVVMPVFLFLFHSGLLNY